MEARKANNGSHTVTVKKIINADRETVFEAWTKPEIMQQWYVGAKGTAKVEVDFRVGGRYSNEMLLEGDCSSEKAPGRNEIKSYLHYGEYLEIVRPERLVFMWNSPFVQNTTVTVELREVHSGTEVTITHELTSEEECQAHTQGWTYALEGLSTLLG